MMSSKFRARRLLLSGFCAIGGVIALSGCASAQQGDANAAPASTDYRLGPGDQLRIMVFGEPDLTGPYTVNPQGKIAFPLVGEINAAGLTIPELTTQIEAALRSYIRAPRLSIEVANFRPFFILGEVNRPGTYPYSANLNVLNAVATAGGFTYRANRRKVYIKHASETEEREYHLDNSTPVMPGDTVRIGERLF
jgi:polysaccharide export outer membrane protein